MNPKNRVTRVFNSAGKSAFGNPRDTKTISVCCESVTLMTAEREGVQASQGARNHTIFVITLPENARERGHVAARQTKTLRLVDFLTSKGIVKLPPSVFFDSLLLRRSQ